jgi:hypothetical protein
MCVLEICTSFFLDPRLLSRSLFAQRPKSPLDRCLVFLFSSSEVGEHSSSSASFVLSTACASGKPEPEPEPAAARRQSSLSTPANWQNRSPELLPAALVNWKLPLGGPGRAGRKPQMDATATTFQLQPVVGDDAALFAAFGKVHTSCPLPKGTSRTLEIVRVQRVEDPALFSAYKRRTQDMYDRLRVPTPASTCDDATCASLDLPLRDLTVPLRNLGERCELDPGECFLFYGSQVEWEWPRQAAAHHARGSLGKGPWCRKRFSGTRVCNYRGESAVRAERVGAMRETCVRAPMLFF